MPLFGWMKWSQEAGVQAQDEAAPLNTLGAVPSRMLIRELLWHVEERERLARELEREHRLAHSALGFHWFQKYPRLRTLIPTSELHQLECLCAQIPPVHTATVLSRCLVAAVMCSVLTLTCCQQWLAATAPTQRLTVGKGEKKTQREREAGQAAKEAIMCYCHRDRLWRVLTCEGERCPIRELPGILLISISSVLYILKLKNIYVAMSFSIKSLKRWPLNGCFTMSPNNFCGWPPIHKPVLNRSLLNDQSHHSNMTHFHPNEYIN